MVPSKLCPYEGVQLGGVIDYYRKATGKSNPADSGFISLNASINKDKANRVFIVDADDNCYWEAYDNECWIEFDFKRNRLNITGYTLNSFSWEYLREWKVIASIDKIEWKDIDHETLSAAPEGSDKISTYFQVDTPFFARYIRIIRIGTRFSTLYPNLFVLRTIDFFGKFFSWRELNKLSRIRKYWKFYAYNFFMTFILSA